MLRSHGTVIVASALRHLAAERHPPADVLLACPGISCRCDAIDWQHTGTRSSSTSGGSASASSSAQTWPR
jgi:hypothetical protein